MRTDGTVDARTRAALRRAEEAGALVVFVTGRPPRWMVTVDGLVDHTVAVCANGALVYDMHTDEIVAAHRIDVVTLRTVVDRLAATLPAATFAVEYGLDFACEPGYRPHVSDRGRADVRIAPRAEILDRPVAKLLLRDDSGEPDDMLVQATEVVGELVTVTSSSRDGLLEISARGVSKAFTLARLAERHGIAPEDVLAFGDMPNDLAILGWAGRSVAVANAHPAVLAAVDEVTMSNDESGVALVLERVFGAEQRSPCPQGR